MSSLPPPALAAAFLAALEGGQAGQAGTGSPAISAGQDLASAALLEPLLQRLVADARAAFPTLSLPPEEFARELAVRLDPGEEPAAALAGIRAADLWLSLACANGDAAALRIFDESYLSKVPALIRRADADGQLGPEVTQLLREQLLIPTNGRARLADYSGRGDLLGWLRVVALRAALKLKRRQARAAGEPHSTGEVPEGLLAGADPERDYLRLHYRDDYQAALRDALAALPNADRLLLKLHYIDGLTLPKLAAMYRVHRATIARRLAEARRGLLEQTRALLALRLKLTHSEFESVLQLVRSQLGLSLRDLGG